MTVGQPNAKVTVAPGFDCTPVQLVGHKKIFVGADALS